MFSLIGFIFWPDSGALPTKASDLFCESDLDLVMGQDGTCLDLDEGGDCSLIGRMKGEEESHLFSVGGRGRQRPELRWCTMSCRFLIDLLIDRLVNKLYIEIVPCHVSPPVLTKMQLVFLGGVLSVSCCTSYP